MGLGSLVVRSGYSSAWITRIKPFFPLSILLKLNHDEADVEERSNETLAKDDKRIGIEPREGDEIRHVCVHLKLICVYVFSTLRPLALREKGHKAIANWALWCMYCYSLNSETMPPSSRSAPKDTLRSTGVLQQRNGIKPGLRES
jgi:hypothetical protein